MQTKLSKYLIFSWNSKRYPDFIHFLVLALQHAIKIGDVADGEPEDLDLRELLVRRQGGQERSQRAEGRVERLFGDRFTQYMFLKEANVSQFSIFMDDNVLK